MDVDSKYGVRIHIFMIHLLRSRAKYIGVEYDGAAGARPSTRMHYGAEASSPRQLFVKDSGKKNVQSMKS